MNRVASVIEILIGILLFLAIAILLLNTEFCFFNQDACGMIEPMLVLYATPVALSFLAAGFFHHRGKAMAGALAYVPIIAIVILLVGQALLWW